MGISAVLLAVVALAGAGISYSSSVSAAKASDAMALANSQAAVQSAQNEGRMGQAQAQLNAIKAQKEQEAAYANAAGIRNQTEAESTAAQENIRRSRDDFARMLASQRAATAGRGVVDTTGSPLELLVKGSESEALNEHEMRYADEINRKQGFRSADLEQVHGQVAGLDVGMAMLNGAAAQNRAQMQITQAGLDLWGTRAQNSASRTAALGSLVSSVGSTYSSYSSLSSSTPRTMASYRQNQIA